MSYAALVFDNQHRTHQFSLILFGTMARLARWDRAGVIFSEAFDYVKDPTHIARFLWRYVRMTPEQQGHDTTATKVPPKSKDHDLVLERAKNPLMIGGHKVGEHARHEFAKSTKDARWFWKLKVFDGKKAREFLVGRPHFIAYGLAGRGTKGFVAIDCNDPEGPLVYLKDVWRVVHPELRREGDILAHLRGGPGDTPVPDIPTLICHGDVGDQITRSKEIWKEQNLDASDDQCPPKTHRHYRLVMKEVGLPISEFRNGCELVYLILRAIRAHKGAYEKGVLHRDISAGNVLISIVETVSPQGEYSMSRAVLLADWELSKFVNDEDSGPRQPGRTGTWQFASAAALSDLSKEIDVADEMESFFHLLLYLSIRYLPHNIYDVGRFMEQYFDGHSLNANFEYHGGFTKYNMMFVGAICYPDTHLRFLARRPPPMPKLPAPSAAPASSKKGKVTKDPGNSHRINKIFGTMLTWLSARYRLNKERLASSQGSQPEPTSSREPAESAIWKSLDDSQKAQMFDIIASILPASMKRSRPAEESSSEEAYHGWDAHRIHPDERKKLEELAAKLSCHNEVLRLFAVLLHQRPAPGEADWDPDDKVPDQLLPDYRTGDERSTYRSTLRTSQVPSGGAEVRSDGEPQRKKLCTDSLRSNDRPTRKSEVRN
ncbi:hypothetical protein C8Q77DRAFT_1143806 [Trametes polyzona]|nr:hypothetical protein C8Q77DRAFT_1143806 [Trametes polyzona]